MSNMQTIDLTKLSLEELDKVKFLFPDAVEAEMKSRACYETDDDLYLDAYSVKMVLEPLINGMKSCPTKKALLDSGVLNWIEKVLNTGDKKNKNYKERWAALNPTPVEEAIQVAVDADVPAGTLEPQVAEVEPVAAPAPAAFVPASAPAQALSMDAIMATANMMKNNG